MAYSTSSQALGTVSSSSGSSTTGVRVVSRRAAGGGTWVRLHQNILCIYCGKHVCTTTVGNIGVSACIWAMGLCHLYEHMLASVL